MKHLSVSCWLLSAAALTASVAGGQTLSRAPQVNQPEVGGRFERFRLPYVPRTVSHTDFSNSFRWDSLIRGNNIYLSLADALALALENNLDIEWQRYSPRIAETDVLRTEGGGLTRGLNVTIRESPNGVGGPQPANPGQSAAVTSSILSQPDTSTSQAETNVSVTGNIPLSIGPRLPSLDPFLSGTVGYSNRTAPQTNNFIAGTNALINKNFVTDFGIQQSFSTGTTLGLQYNNIRQTTNGSRVDYNPYTNASLGITFDQPLLQGFGSALNRRYLRIAKNDQKISDTLFRLQCSNTVSAVIRLYWDLVSLNEDLKVKRQALELAQQLATNNRSQVEVGTLAPIEVVRAQAEVARARQDLTNAESLVLQQEVILKNVLSRTGSSDPRLASAHIIPTDQITIPAEEPVRPLQDLIETALKSRPDLNMARLQYDNSQISYQGARNALLPSIDVVAGLTNNALAGQVNSLLPPGQATGGTTGSALTRVTDPTFVGGYGTVLSQLFTRSFGDYNIGVQVTIPLRNRVAQADAARDQLATRQNEVRVHSLENQVRTEVETALLNLRRARASYESASQTRQLQEEALSAEQQKYEVGASTSFFVIQYQRDLAQARSQEVIAQSAYIKAKANLDRVMGIVLRANNITPVDAYQGDWKNAPAMKP